MRAMALSRFSLGCLSLATRAALQPPNVRHLAPPSTLLLEQRRGLFDFIKKRFGKKDEEKKTEQTPPQPQQPGQGAVLSKRQLWKQAVAAKAAELSSEEYLRSKQQNKERRKEEKLQAKLWKLPENNSKRVKKLRKRWQFSVDQHALRKAQTKAAREARQAKRRARVATPLHPKPLGPVLRILKNAELLQSPPIQLKASKSPSQ